MPCIVLLLRAYKRCGTPCLSPEGWLDARFFLPAVQLVRVSGGAPRRTPAGVTTVHLPAKAGTRPLADLNKDGEGVSDQTTLNGVGKYIKRSVS